MANIIHVIAGAMCVDSSDFLEMKPLGLVLSSSTGSLIRNKADSHRVSPEPGALPRKPRAEWEPGARLLVTRASLCGFAQSRLDPHLFHDIVIELDI